MPDPLRCLCELAKEWLDPTKIPVEEIAEEWRSQSKRGRYKAAMWRTAGLEEPTAKAGRGELGGEVAKGEVDNAATPAASSGAWARAYWAAPHCHPAGSGESGGGEPGSGESGGRDEPLTPLSRCQPDSTLVMTTWLMSMRPESQSPS